MVVKGRGQHVGADVLIASTRGALLAPRTFELRPTAAVLLPLPYTPRSTRDHLYEGRRA